VLAATCASSGVEAGPGLGTDPSDHTVPFQRSASLTLVAKPSVELALIAVTT